MFFCNFSNNLIKNGTFCFKICRSFSETNENLLNLFKNLKDAQSRNELFKLPINLGKIQDSTVFHPENPEKHSESPDSGLFPECVTRYSVLPPSHLISISPSSDSVLYRQNKSLIVDCFADLVRFRSKNYDLVSFLSDSVGVILNDLGFSDVYRLINVIIGRKLGDSPIDDKISSVFHSLLKRVNFLISERLSYTRGIVKVSNLSKYHKSEYETDSESGLGIDLSSTDHLDKMWLLWYKLSKYSQSESKYTISLLLSLLELQSGRIFQFDLMRVTRTLDIVVGDYRNFTKLDERVILKLLKRFRSLISHIGSEDDLNLFISNNNLTPVHVKKFFCNLSRVSKISPKILMDILGQEKSYLAFKNFTRISRVLIGNEISKVYMSNTSTDGGTKELSDFINSNLEDLLAKFDRLFLKILSDSVDIIKLLDYINLEQYSKDRSNQQNHKGCKELRNELILLSNDIIKNINPKGVELIFSEIRNMYYLLLTNTLGDFKENTYHYLKDLELLETISTKICKNTSKLVDINSSDKYSNDNINLSFRPIQYLLYCDKIDNLLKELKIDSEHVNNISSMCEVFAKKLSYQHQALFSVSGSFGLKTLYATLLNKYKLLSPEIYSNFLNGLDNWECWNRKEISMLCDLFSRTYTNLTTTLTDSSELVAKVGLVLESLIDYFFFQGNSFKLGNKEFITLVSCINNYKNHLNLTDKSLDQLIIGEISSRLNTMNFNQIIKLLIVDNSEILIKQIREELVQRLLDLNHLGDVSSLAILDDKDLIYKILDKFDIEIVEDHQIKFEKLLKNKFLKQFSKTGLQNSFTTLDVYNKLKTLNESV